MYAAGEIGINGEWLPSPIEARLALRTLADERRLPAPALAALPASVWPLLHGWHVAGWLGLDGSRSR
jgi:hypothetical protein